MISVCLATFNGERFISEQINSILSQISDSDEIIVSDDGSTDKTIQILEAYKDKRIHILQNSGTHGVIGNFENALKNANGDYIFLSDQDDVWFADKVRICLQELAHSDCVVHDCRVTDENLKILTQSFFEEINVGTGVFKNFYKNTFTGCCMAFNRKVLESVLPFPNSRLFYHDQWIGLISLISFKTTFIQTPLIYFRRHSSNTSSAATRSILKLSQKIQVRLSMLKALSIKYLKRK